MNRLTHLILALACAGLMILLLALAVAAQAPAQPNQEPIKVPDDYPTIQQAIDAAEEGDEIWVAAGTYLESLSITKGITLSGGWNITFTVRTPGDSTIDGLGLRRVISITCPTSDTVVTIDGFTVANGNATLRGGGPPGLRAAEELPGSGVALTPDPLTPAERLARLEADLAGVVERGLYPGGPAAYRAMLDRVQQQIGRLEQAGSQPQVSEQPSQEATDCGGGIYSWNASLHLLNSRLSFNVASRRRDGCGGGVFVGRSAPGGVLIRGNTLRQNIATTGPDSLGRGGGLFAILTPGIVVEGNVFQENAAASGGRQGGGGGLHVEASSDVVVRDNQVVRNTASAGWEPSTGMGGGASLFHVWDATVAHNQFQENLAGVHGEGAGGALYVAESGRVVVADNDVIGNWACMFQMASAAAGGGGIALYSMDDIAVTGNVIRDNTASVSSPGFGQARGGGLDAETCWHPLACGEAQVVGNSFSGNVASLSYMSGYGGGAHLMDTRDTVVAGNSFDSNVANVGGVVGWGGGLYLAPSADTRIQGNTFHENMAVASGEGTGGGLCVWEESLELWDATVDGNLFLDNQADTDLAFPVPSSGGACAFKTGGLTFTNNVVTGNRADGGGGLLVGHMKEGGVTNNTLVGNSVDGILVHPTNLTPITITNNIVVSHSVGISVGQGTTATVRYTLWQGNDTDIGGTGLVTHTHPVIGNPAFVDPAVDNYHLTAVSAARDAGDPAGVPPAPDHDADGVLRPQGPAVDLGAYEWQGHLLYLPLVYK